MSKTISKAYLKELVEAKKKTWNWIYPVDSAVSEYLEVAKRVEEICDGVKWHDLTELVRGVYVFAGDDENLFDALCKVFEVLGWTVTDEGGSEE